jgi:hypothetical protein
MLSFAWVKGLSTMLRAKLRHVFAWRLKPAPGNHAGTYFNSGIESYVVFVLES